MSPDDIFAAQFWPWPDPAVKRDATGRVLFVNAAFLQLYGGQAQDWHDNAIGGWPAPQGPGQPYRFETRIPGQPGEIDQVYDWIEMTMADGSAFTLARNVTAFTVPTDPHPGQEMVSSQDTQAQDLQEPDPVSAPAPEAAPAATTPDEYYTETPPAAPPPAEPQYEPTPALTTAPAMEADPLEDTATITEQTAAPAATTGEFKPVFEHAPVEDAVQSAPQQDPEVAPVEPSESQTEAPVEAEPNAQPERAYERRALPIESDSAVLGNNWRDAVIAKAVGAEAPKPAEAVAETQPQETLAEGEGYRILLAEDNAINALLTRTLLEAEGHTVETVEDGVLAVEAMKTASYDLIFMDMRMPNMDGLEATRKIRLLPNVPKNLPIVALTANAFDDDRNACFDSGMNDFMTKPVSAEELSEMVENWMSGDRQAIAS
ncbi:response regulator [Litorimonas sp. RW-G-Af-16]|uniref:response regulator n=1 Tax=Litorimonas sp. RW-G-Af-16 TaxID=3241168 RepID=UPI00390CA636